MKKNILLTCFGDKIFYEVFNDFRKRDDINLFVSDINPKVKASLLTPNFIHVLPVEDNNFCLDLLEKAKSRNIQMIIPSGDEEVLALMKGQKLFENEEIVVAVQAEEKIPIFCSKTAMYDFLKEKEFPLPRYFCVRTKNELEAALGSLGYPESPLFIKPNSARGGRGIAILSERPLKNSDHLSVMDKNLVSSLIDGKKEFIIMEYLQGDIYDVDVLCYKNGGNYFGVRRRLNNVTKFFTGNYFEENEAILSFAKKLYQMVPTRYLVDYDILVGQDKQIHLLEVNPRPSGSMISYIPFGVNLYHVLAKSYLSGEHIPIPSLKGYYAQAFYKMIGDRL